MVVARLTLVAITGFALNNMQRTRFTVGPCARNWREMDDLYAAICWNEAGLVPVIVQEVESNDVLMLAWMDREALRLTVEAGRTVFSSRSRAGLWFKGEESGHLQEVREIRLDCDRDVLLIRVVQHGHVRPSHATRGDTAASSTLCAKKSGYRSNLSSKTLTRSIADCDRRG